MLRLLNKFKEKNLEPQNLSILETLKKNAKL